MLSIVLNLSIAIVSFNILKKLKVNIYVNCLCILIYNLLFNNIMTIDYNFLQLLLLLIIINSELKRNQIDIIKPEVKHELIIRSISSDYVYVQSKQLEY